MSELIFVYGTLMRGRSNHSVIAGSRFLGPARAKGLALYQVSKSFPGAVRENGGEVIGEVYEVGKNKLRDLDLFEGEGYLYRREKVKVLLKNENGKEIEAWVYIWNGRVNPSTRIPLEAQPWRPLSILKRKGRKNGKVSFLKT